MDIFWIKLFYIDLMGPIYINLDRPLETMKSVTESPHLGIVLRVYDMGLTENYVSAFTGVGFFNPFPDTNDIWGLWVRRLLQMWEKEKLIKLFLTLNKDMNFDFSKT